MAKKRLYNKPRKRKQTHQVKQSGSFLLFILTRLFAGICFVTLIVLLYLDLEIRQRFSGNIQSQPAHIYARPLSLFPGASISSNELITILKKKGYHSTGVISEPGDFVSVTNAMDIYIRAFGQENDFQTAQAIRINFANNTISEIINHATAKPIDQIDLDPPLIGSLQLGAYKDRISLRLHQMPELLLRALLAMEDRNFETHIGIDPKGIARAFWSNIRNGKAIQGGSTLTQQLVKNLFLSPERTITRKVTEALMALMMELRFSKGEILELYLNEIFLGQSGNRAVHGFALASEYYFGRSVNELKLHQTALLVGMIPAPSSYNPRRHPDRALIRRNIVLNKLAEVGAISRYTAETISQKPLDIVEHKSASTSEFPTYMDYLHRQLRQYYSEEVLRTNGLKLYTSLDVGIQRVAQNTLSNSLAKLEQRKNLPSGVLQGAIIVIDPRRGEILALVGDRQKGYSGFNRAIDAQRPIGSLVKPAVYLSALERPEKYSLTTILDDSPITLQPKGGEIWSPQNYDKEFRGPLPLYQGLIKSYNLPTVRLGLDLGVDTVIDTMHRLGIERDIANYPSTLLGANQHTPLEIAQMYQTISNDGELIPLRSIRSIQNHREETVARFSASSQRVVDQDSAFLIDYALKMVVRQGTAAGLTRTFNPNLQLAGKTGTTDNFRDSWFAGYSENLLAVVWVGRDDNKPIHLSGSSGAMWVWENMMSQLELESPDTTIYGNIIMAKVDPQSGLVANSKCPEQLELPFVNGSQPESFAPCSGLAAKLKSWFKINGDKSPSVKIIDIDPSESRP